MRHGTISSKYPFAAGIILLLTLAQPTLAQRLPSTPPPSALGPVAPLVAAMVRPIPASNIGGFAEYLLRQAWNELPDPLLHGAPKPDAAVGWADPVGPAAILVPAQPANNKPNDGAPAAWLLLRYATLQGPAGEIPTERLAYLVTPGPMRFTFLPLVVDTHNGLSSLQVLGKDGQPVLAVPFTPAAGAVPVGLELGTPGSPALQRSITVQLSGSSAVLQVGEPPASQILPRPVEGELHLGDLAPDFELKTIKADRAVHLTDTRGRLPTVLIFGSYT